MLAELPEELLEMMVELLDAGPPSLAPDGQHPQSHLFQREATPLKCLSRVSKKMRRIVSKTLFTNLRLTASVLANEQLPFDSRTAFGYEAQKDIAKDRIAGMLGGFEQFIKRQKLRLVQSLLVWSTEESDLKDGGEWKLRNYGSLHTFWKTLMQTVGFHQLILIAPPQALARFTQIQIDYHDRWAFDIPYQRLMLSLDIADDSGYSVLTDLLDTQEPMPLISMLPWQQLHYDEGSSLNLYGHYHYQDKKSPSLLNAQDKYLEHSVDGLQSLTYTSIFPHFESFAQFSQRLLNRCYGLETLTLSLAPDPHHRSILDDTDRIGRGSTSFRDCWQEVDRCYADVVRHLAWTDRCNRSDLRPGNVLFRLRQIRILDCRIAAIDEDLRQAFAEKLPAWTRTGRGVWEKTMASEAA